MCLSSDLGNVFQCQPNSHRKSKWLKTDFRFGRALRLVLKSCQVKCCVPLHQGHHGGVLFG